MSVAPGSQQIDFVHAQRSDAARVAGPSRTMSASCHSWRVSATRSAPRRCDTRRPRTTAPTPASALDENVEAEFLEPRHVSGVAGHAALAGTRLSSGYRRHQ